MLRVGFMSREPARVWLFSQPARDDPECLRLSEWVYVTLAEAHQGLGQTSDEERLERKIESEASSFGKISYLEQKAKFKEAIEEFERRVRPAELNAQAVAGGAQPMTEPVEVESGGHDTTMQQFRPPVSSGHNPIMIDADIVRGKPIKSIEVNCKIEYL